MFYFGLLTTLDPLVAMVSILGIIFFVNIFDFLTGLLEYVLTESPLYSNMVQKIYKELMQMGIISFGVSIYFAADESSNEIKDEWLSGIDCADSLVFVVTLFFVVHAIFLMVISISSSHQYFKYFYEDLGQLYGAIGDQNWLQNILYNSRWLPLSSLRDRVEFKLMHALFRDTHTGLPFDFNFSLYLAKSFERYALKSVEIGKYSWLTVVFMLLANYVRIKTNFVFNCGSNVISFTKSSVLYLYLPINATIDEERANCNMTQVQLFYVCAFCLTFYAIALLLIGRMYILRCVMSHASCQCMCLLLASATVQHH